MRYKDTDITGNRAFEPETEAGGKRERGRDTDLGEPSVSRREARRMEKKGASPEPADRAPWDEPATAAEKRGKRKSAAAHDAMSSDAEQSPAEPADPARGMSTPGNPAQGLGNEPAGADQRKGKSTYTLASVLSGNILSKKEVRRAYPYMIFVACLMFLYIANVFRTQYIYRERAALTEQVKELRSKSMTIASDKMKATRQSNIMLELERRNIPLKESLTPNKVIPRDKAAHGQKENDR